ncbi:class I SAM-dependent methyltransferase [Granulicoccus phenolivorans]|uniref:class I SAM-dependent methyltransferase n=1 Tax=Granulicoccus phenolivorans TaxID=266854 RepID=UPI0004216B6A|nr:class I SAM-dependent methyltransferase [Granulicoccus phenolivorans]
MSFHQPAASVYPVRAVDWLVEEPDRVCDVGSGSGQLAAMLAGRGHLVHTVDADPARAPRLAARLGHDTHVIARAEALPFASGTFGAVTVQHALRGFAPGLALAEFSRVLRPGGRIGVIFHSRDDSVPWVKRLAERLQRADPTAMRGDYGQDAWPLLAESPYFTDAEERIFRDWKPITRAGLQHLVAHRPAVGALRNAERSELLADIGDVYDSVSRGGQPLLLPFQAVCWRAVADHRELDFPVPDSDGLRIHV